MVRKSLIQLFWWVQCFQEHTQLTAFPLMSQKCVCVCVCVCCFFTAFPILQLIKRHLKPSTLTEGLIVLNLCQYFWWLMYLLNTENTDYSPVCFVQSWSNRDCNHLKKAINIAESSQLIRLKFLITNYFCFDNFLVAVDGHEFFVKVYFDQTKTTQQLQYVFLQQQQQQKTERKGSIKQLFKNYDI